MGKSNSIHTSKLIIIVFIIAFSIFMIAVSYEVALHPHKFIYLFTFVVIFIEWIDWIYLSRKNLAKATKISTTKITPAPSNTRGALSPFIASKPDATKTMIQAAPTLTIVFQPLSNSFHKFLILPINKATKPSLLSLSERGNPTPMFNARLPQKMPSASLGHARLPNTAITQGEPSPEARRASPLTQKRSLDHDHATGEPRGLLYQPCNLKVAQIETRTKKLNYIISRLMLVELALQFRKRHYQLFYAVLSYTEGLLALRCLSWL